ncbi:NAD(P)/FAD-dependent oxidoreductase [Paludibacterium yongneupense]|uniref:NAD(P)/FAD-dependent oxidoreductase n=1 Tax=Paludibacterium yongneupense TaxID=400061 RepID=UPI00040D8F42|nr:FAD-binding oxidoreductase [Paludibacterium yongneupense]
MSHPLAAIASDEALPAAVDVLVVGGGIIGICAALDLARRGLRVAVVEKGEIAAEQSSRNWGWIRQQGRDRRELPLIVKSVAIWESLQAGLSGDIGFRRTGLTSLTRSRKELARWQRWAERGRAAGIRVELLDAVAAERALPSRGRPWVGGIATPDDAQAEPSVAVVLLAEAARNAGVTLHQRTAVRGLDISSGRVRGVFTEHGPVRASSVLVAAGAWSSRLLRPYGIRLPQLDVRSTVVRTPPTPPLIASTFCSSDFCLRNRLDGGLTLTLRGHETSDLVLDSFRYFFAFLPLWRRHFRDLKLCLGAPFLSSLVHGGTRSPDRVSLFERIRINDPAPDAGAAQLALKRLNQGRPELGGVVAAEIWAGRIDMTPDLLPVISAVSTVEGLVVATGFSGHGFGIGPGAGRLAADLITHAPPLVDPHAFRLGRFDEEAIFIDPDVI